MYWTNPAETMDATPFIQAVSKALPPYWDKQQIDLYASLTEPLARQSTAWFTQLAQEFKPITPLPDFSESLRDADHWLEWMVQAQQQLWTQWADFYQQWPTGLDKAVNEGEQLIASAIDTVSDSANIAAELEARIAMAPTGIGTAEVSATKAPDEESVAIDDLTAIAGIGSGLARKLNDAGIKTYADIAAWSAADIDTIEQTVLGGRFAGRIQRDDWIGQARALSMRD